MLFDSPPISELTELHVNALATEEPAMAAAAMDLLQATRDLCDAGKLYLHARERYVAAVIDATLAARAERCAGGDLKESTAKIAESKSGNPAPRVAVDATDIPY